MSLDTAKVGDSVTLVVCGACGIAYHGGVVEAVDTQSLVMREIGWGYPGEEFFYLPESWQAKRGFPWKSIERVRVHRRAA